MANGSLLTRPPPPEGQEGLLGLKKSAGPEVVESVVGVLREVQDVQLEGPQGGRQGGCRPAGVGGWPTGHGEGWELVRDGTKKA